MVPYTHCYPKVMSNSVGNAPPDLADIVQLALATYIKEIFGPIYVMILASLWLGISLSLFTALLCTSGAQSRRKPIFILCVIAVAIGTIPSVLYLKIIVSEGEGICFKLSQLQNIL